MLKEGTRSFSAAEIHETTDYYGAHLEASSDKDMAYVALYSLNKHLNHLLPVLERSNFGTGVSGKRIAYPDTKQKTGVSGQLRKSKVHCPVEIQ